MSHPLPFFLSLSFAEFPDTQTVTKMSIFMSVFKTSYLFYFGFALGVMHRKPLLHLNLFGFILILMIKPEFPQNMFYGQYFCGILPGINQKKDSIIK